MDVKDESMERMVKTMEGMDEATKEMGELKVMYTCIYMDM